MRRCLIQFAIAWQVLSSFNFAKAANEFEVTELAPVQIRSQLDKQGTPLIHAPGSFANKDQSQINERAGSTLGDLLDFEPNVEFVGGPRGAAELPQIRGLGSDRILILDEGVRQNFQSGHNGRMFSDFSLMESIEVVKGPWSSLYGSGAMGGVISFRRSTAADLIRRTGLERGLEVGFEASSAADQSGQRLTAFGKAGIFEPLVSVHHSKANDVRLGTDERLAYSANEADDIYSSIGFRFSENHHFHLKLGTRQEKADTLINPNNELTPSNPAADMKSVKQDFVGDYQFKNADWDFHAKPFYRNTKVEKVRIADKRTDTQTVETTGIDLWNNFAVSFSESVKSVITLGADTFTDRNTGTRGSGPLAAFPNGRGEQLGVYAQPSIIVGEKLTLTPGLRHDAYKTEDLAGTAKSTSGESTSAKMYAAYEYNAKQIIFAGWGQAFNAPRLQDLYVSGVHFPGNFFVPNPDLKPERAETFEVGFKNQHLFEDQSLVRWTGTYFQTRAQDFIQQNVMATTTNFINIEEVHLVGAEFSSFYQQSNWGAGLSYGSVRSKDNATGEPLPDTPADQFNLRAEYYISDQLTLGTDSKWAQKQARVPAGTSESPEYYAQDVHVSWKQPVYSVNLRINNAFDRNFRRHGSGINEVGRDIRLTLSYAF